MDRNALIHAAGRIVCFCARHTVAIVVLAILACLFWTAAYIALLLWAMVVGGGIGGPLAYPVGLIFFSIAGALVSLFVFLPSTVFAEWLARRRGWPVLAQIPISIAVLGVLSLIVIGIAYAAESSKITLLDAAIGFGVLFAIHLIPLGIYWWIAQSVPLATALFRRFRLKPRIGAGT